MKPIVTLKVSLSLDGYMDDCSDQRLVLSSEEDLLAVDRLRAESDAILVGAETIRKDNPALVLKSGEKGPVKVTMTSCGELDAGSNFFKLGEGEKIVYASESCFAELIIKLEAKVVKLVDGSLDFILEDLGKRGIKKLLVEGGADVSNQFLSKGYVDFLRVAISPLVVADINAPRFNIAESFDRDSIELISSENFADTVVLNYKLKK